MRKTLLCSLLLFSQLAFAQLKLARLFSDHVVLQRQKPIIVWGWATPLDKVTVKLASQVGLGTADSAGKWTITLSALEAGGPHQLVASTKTQQVKVEDVLIGEVWLCSGQSNMEWPVKQADQFREEQRNADFPQIRHFFVEHDVQLQPQADLKRGEWKVCSPQTVGDFTAVGFFFARELAQKLKVPVGLVHASWGGSQLEGWLSKEAMTTHEDLRSYVQQLPQTWDVADEFHGAKLRQRLLGTKVLPTAAFERSYLTANYDFSNWHQAGSPLGQWDWKGIWAFRGKGYMARSIELSADFIASSPTVLGLGVQDSFNEIYLNGELVFAGIVKGQRRIQLPTGVLKPGRNALMVKFGNMIELPWYGLGVMGNLEDLYLDTPQERISLANDWKIMPSFAEKHEYVHSSNNIGTTIFNGMIAPLIPFGLKGVLWYQGESNAGRAYQYRSTFPLMITDWRKHWQSDFSFYFVQLSSFGSNQSSNQGSNWAELREAQTMTLALPKTGMAVTIDVGNPTDIHPTNKQDVGHRLALQALQKDFQQSTIAEGPTLIDVQYRANQATLSFRNIGQGLVVQDKFGYLRGFEVASEDRKFYFAQSEISGNQVVVRHPQGQTIVAVRYAWADAPVDANLFNRDGLPAAPFRTDQWPGLTIKQKFD